MSRANEGWGALCRPYTTSEQQVLDFFAGYNVNEVAFVYEPDGRPSGLVGGRCDLEATPQGGISSASAGRGPPFSTACHRAPGTSY